jgi:hypothetical protein
MTNTKTRNLTTMHKRTFITLLLIGLLTHVALAIHPQRWEHTTEADFEPGVADDVLITNLGDLKLAADTKLMEAIPQLGSVIFDMHESSDGSIYIASGPQSAIIRKSGDKVDVIAELPTEQVFTLGELPEGNLLMGISGTPSRLAYLDHEGKIQTLIELPEVRYIWDMIVRDDSVILATGTEGKLLKVLLNAKKSGEDKAVKPQDKPAESVDKQAKPAASQQEKQADETIQKSDENMPMQHDTHDATEDPTDEPVDHITDRPVNVIIVPATPGTDDKDAKESKDTKDASEETPAANAKETEEKPDTQKAPVIVKVEPAAMEPAKIEPVIVTYAPTVTELYDASQTNLLCLGQDKNNRIYVGTDTDGLVYRFTEKADGGVSAFVLYDAAEPEIGALLVFPDGTTYAGTADANQARPGRLSKASNKEVGRPKVVQPATPKQPINPPHNPPTPDPAKDQKDAPQAVPAKQPEPAAQAVPEAKAPEAPAATDEPKPEDKPVVIKVTSQQRDALREEVREQLLAARDQGEMAPMQSGETVGLNRPAPGRANAGPGRRTPVRSKHTATKGNAVYRISPHGFVSEVFRESVMILKLIAHDGKLVVATGNEGQLFQVDPSAQETTIIAQLEPEQIPAMLHAKDGTLILGTANPAQIISMSTGFAKQGTFTSDVMDASQISRWGNMQFVADIPDKTTIELQTRSGNMQDPDKAPWADWSEPIIFDHDAKHNFLVPRDCEITSPPARYLQYRITLKGDGSITPTLDRITTNFAMPNLRPQVESLTAVYPDEKTTPGGKTAVAVPAPSAFGNAPNKEPEHLSKLQIEWKASDPNSDKLQYRLEYQIGGTGKWILLRYRLQSNRFEWDTIRAPDGRYLLRVIASDDLDNPSSAALTDVRTSDPILIDNNPPVFANLKGEIKDHNLILVGSVADALSNIAAVHYSVDAYNNWKPVLPKDQIFDSTKEDLAFMISGLSTGRHVITLRVLDDRNNAAYQAVTIDMK